MLDAVGFFKEGLVRVLKKEEGNDLYRAQGAFGVLEKLEAWITENSPVGTGRT